MTSFLWTKDFRNHLFKIIKISPQIPLRITILQTRYQTSPVHFLKWLVLKVSTPVLVGKTPPPIQSECLINLAP